MSLLVSLPQLTELAKPWADAFADSKVLSVVTTALHLCGIVTGGGLAIATDRALLRTSATDGSAQRRMLADLGSAHGMIIASLAVIVSSGLLLLASDLNTFASSRVFWFKMGLLFLLLSNGLRLRSAERACQRLLTADAMSSTPVPASLWQILRTSSVVSLVLWFSLVLCGVTLTSV